MQPLTDHLTVVEDDDLVGVHDRSDALGHDQYGLGDRFLAQRGAQPGVGGEVECRKTVVEDIDFGPPRKSSGDRQSLLWPPETLVPPCEIGEP